MSNNITEVESEDNFIIVSINKMNNKSKVEVKNEINDTINNSINKMNNKPKVEAKDEINHTINSIDKRIKKYADNQLLKSNITRFISKYSHWIRKDIERMEITVDYVQNELTQIRDTIGNFINDIRNQMNTGNGVDWEFKYYVSEVAHYSQLVVIEIYQTLLTLNPNHLVTQEINRIFISSSKVNALLFDFVHRFPLEGIIRSNREWLSINHRIFGLFEVFKDRDAMQRYQEIQLQAQIAAQEAAQIEAQEVEQQ